MVYRPILAYGSYSKRSSYIRLCFLQNMLDRRAGPVVPALPNCIRPMSVPLELHDVDHLAFHGRAAFAHPRDVDLATRHGREAGELELVVAVRKR